MESYTYSPDKKSSTECRTSNFAICTTFLHTQNVDDFISEKICFIQDTLGQRARRIKK
jgi:hypothetical protein